MFPYTSKTFNNTYKFNNEPMDQATAEATCKCQGGHLVSYINAAEQVGHWARLHSASQAPPLPLQALGDAPAAGFASPPA